jgi:hypothetical protein
MKKIIANISFLICKISFYLSSFIVTAALYLCTGYTDPIGLSLTSVVGFLLVLMFRNLVWRRYVAHKKDHNGKKILKEFLLFSVLCQIFLVVVFPASSILPRWFLESFKIAHYVEGEECSIGPYLQSAQNFWGKQIDFTKVHVVEGGIMKNLHYLQKIGWIAKDNNYVRDANVFGNTIYLADISSCLSKPTIFHELTHVWQMQNTVIFGPDQIPEFIHTTYQQFYEPDVPYDYGGYPGLKKAKEEGKPFFDFGMEQQAMMVQHLTWFNDGFEFKENEGGVTFTLEYKDLLQFFVNQMLTFKRS